MRKGWFGPSPLGWGVSASSWQGWVVTVVFIAAVAATMRWLRPALEQGTGWPPLTLSLALIAGWVAIYGCVIWLTYDRGGNRR
jgi:hypothetical protein